MSKIAIPMNIFLLVIGLSFVYVGIFLYEDEEKSIQNKLEEWWINIADSSANPKRHNVFVSRSAESMLQLFSIVFGSKPISTQLVWVSAMYSAAAIHAVSLYLNVNLVSLTVNNLTLSFGPVDTEFRWRALFTITLCVVLGTLYWTRVTFRRENWWLMMIGILVPSFVLPLLPYTVSGSPLLAPVLFFATLSGLVSIIVSRGLLAIASTTESTAKQLGALVVNALFVLLFVMVPALLIFVPYEWRHTSVSNTSWVFGWADIAFANTITAIPAALYITLCIVLLAHRLVWPLIERPIYALQRLGIFRYRKSIALGGFVLISWGMIGDVTVLADWLPKPLATLLKLN